MGGLLADPLQLLVGFIKVARGFSVKSGVAGTFCG